MCSVCIMQLTAGYKFKLKCYDVIAKNQKSIPEVKVVDDFFKQYGHQIISVVKHEAPDEEGSTDDPLPGEGDEALLAEQEEEEVEQENGDDEKGGMDHCYTKQEVSRKCLFLNVFFIYLCVFVHSGS